MKRVKAGAGQRGAAGSTNKTNRYGELMREKRCWSVSGKYGPGEVKKWKRPANMVVVHKAKKHQ